MKNYFKIIQILASAIFLIVFCGFIELNEIIPVKFTEKADSDFISVTKPVISEYAKSLWAYNKMINGLADRDKSIITKEAAILRISLKKSLKTFDAAPEPQSNELKDFKIKYNQAIISAIECLDNFPEAIPAKSASQKEKSSGKKLDKKITDNILKANEKYMDEHNKLTFAFPKFFEISVPEIALGKDDYAYLKAEKELSDNNKDEALRIIDSILKTNNDFFKAHKFKGQILILKNDPKNAEKSFLEALRLNLKDAEVFLSIGKILEMQNKPNDAVNSYEVALKIFADYPEVLYRCGSIMVKNNIRPVEGKERLQKFKSLMPQQRTKSITDEMIENANKLLAQKIEDTSVKSDTKNAETIKDTPITKPQKIKPSELPKPQNKGK